MEARDIKRYLADLGAALKNRGVKTPLRMMLIGGAYQRWKPSVPRALPEFFAGHSVKLGPLNVTWHELTVVATAYALTGLVGFPTLVNERPAFFSWRPEEEGLLYWNFSGDDQHRRRVPEEWTKPPRENPPGRTRKVRKAQRVRWSSQ